MKENQIVKCEECSLMFKQKRHWQKFCSKECQQRYNKKMGVRITLSEWEEFQKLLGEKEPPKA